MSAAVGGAAAADTEAMLSKPLSAAMLIAHAASCAPALAHVAPWSSPEPPPLPAQFLVGIALMAAAGAVVVRQVAALARERTRAAVGRRGAGPEAVLAARRGRGFSPRHSGA